MQKVLTVRSQNPEFVFKLKRKLTSAKRKAVIGAIKRSPLYHKSYKQYGAVWFELRSKKNQHPLRTPDATLTVKSDYIYIMRKSKFDPLWKDLSHLRKCIEKDVTFVMKGVFYSYEP